MSTSPAPPDSSGKRSIGAGFLLAGLVAIAAGLLLPLALGSFSERQALLLALVEALCLIVVGVGVLLMARRLRASHDALWALARRDELTGVGNYRSLHERLAEEVGRHQRHGREFALSCSTSTASRRSTSATATSPATACWPRSGRRCGTR